MLPHTVNTGGWWLFATALFFSPILALMSQPVDVEDEIFLTPPEEESNWIVNTTLGISAIGTGLRRLQERSKTGSDHRSDWSNRAQVAGVDVFAQIRSDYSGEILKLKADFDVSVPAQGTGFKPARKTVADVHELYIEAGSRLTGRLGIVRHDWGVADFFRVTNFPDRVDRKEFIIPISESFYRGVPALTARYRWGDYFAETSILPWHTVDDEPNRQSWWDSRPGKEDLLYSRGIPSLEPYRGILFPEILAWRSDYAVGICSLPEQVRPDNPINGSFLGYACQREPVILSENRSPRSSVASRAGGKAGSFDWHLSYFTGPSKAPYRTLQVVSDTSERRMPVVIIREGFAHEHRVGADFVFAWKQGTIRAEAATSNRRGMIVDSRGNMKEEEGRLMSYAAGADFVFFKGDHRFVIEYMDSFFTRAKFLAEPMSDLFSARYEFSTLDGRLTPSFILIMRPVRSLPGTVQQIQIRYAINDEMEMTTGFLHIQGKDDSLLEIYDGRDVLFFRYGYRY